VSDTAEPSQLLDAVAWVRWARLYFRAFEGERVGLSGEDRADCGILALRCLDEALKLFPRGEAVLDEARLHTEGSREALRGGADRYGRYELMGLKLEISMLLASAGIDPDGGDPGVAHQGLVRLVEAVKRSAAAEPRAGGAKGVLFSGGAAPSLLGHAPDPLRLATAASLPLLPAPSGDATARSRWLGRILLGSAVLAVVAAAAFAVAHALAG
jgi:hypothetical protein